MKVLFLVAFFSALAFSGGSEPYKNQMVENECHDSDINDLWDRDIWSEEQADGTYITRVEMGRDSRYYSGYVQCGSGEQAVIVKDVCLDQNILKEAIIVGLNGDRDYVKNLLTLNGYSLEDLRRLYARDSAGFYFKEAVADYMEINCALGCNEGKCVQEEVPTTTEGSEGGAETEVKGHKGKGKGGAGGQGKGKLK